MHLPSHRCSYTQHPAIECRRKTSAALQLRERGQDARATIDRADFSRRWRKPKIGWSYDQPNKQAPGFGAGLCSNVKGIGIESGVLIGFVNWLGHVETRFWKSCALELHGGMFDVELVRETFLNAYEYFFAVFQMHVRDADVA
jgi:hypothetical protein